MVYEQGQYRGLGNAIKMSRTPPALRRTPPAFGEANREVLREAGFANGEIDRLLKSGIVAATLQKAAQD